MRVMAPMTVEGDDGQAERLACPQCGQDSGLWITLMARIVCEQGHVFHDRRISPGQVSQLHDIALSRAAVRGGTLSPLSRDIHLIPLPGAAGTGDARFDAITDLVYDSDCPPAATRLRVWHAELLREGATTEAREIEARLAAMYEALRPDDRITPQAADRLRRLHDGMLDIGETDFARSIENGLAGSGYPLHPTDHTPDDVDRGGR